MYAVIVHHHCKDWRNGDLEDKIELTNKEFFKTRKAAKEWILKQAKSKGHIEQEWHKGTRPSYVYAYTGVKWIHENTGDEMTEYYIYTLKQEHIR